MKFETNPMVDLRRTTILIMNPKACSWKYFHELHYNYLLRTNSFHALLFAHIFFMNTSSHITISPPLTNSFSFSSKGKHTKLNYFFSQTSHYTSLSLFSLSNGTPGNPSLQSMASSSFMNQWKSIMIFFPMEFRMNFFVPNETLRGFHPLIK